LSDCGTCHDSTRTNLTRPGTIDTAGGDAGIQDVITNTAYVEGSKANCLLCHKDKSASHGIDHLVDTKVTGVGTTCVNCHGTGVDSNANYIDTIHGGSGCGTCHVSAGGGGELVDRSSGGVLASQDKDYETDIPGGGSCTDCHDAYASTFGAAHMVKDHKNAVGDTDMLANTASCTTNCHDGTSLTTILQTVHTNDCTNCHTNTTTNGTLRVSGLRRQLREP
jgi:hypothetical protein